MAPVVAPALVLVVGLGLGVAVLEAAEVALAEVAPAEEVEVAPEAAAEVVPAAAGRAGKGHLDETHCNPGAALQFAPVVRGLEHVARESS